MIDIFTSERKLLIGGEWTLSDETFEVTDPQDGSILTRLPAASVAQMDAAIEGAKQGAQVARALPVHQRKAILQRTAQLVAERAEQYAGILSRDCSKTIREARAELRRAADTLQLSAEEASRGHGETIPFDQRPGAERRIGYYDRFPLGIIGAITPFNDPLNLVAHKLGPAIATGNAVVLKPSSVAPLGALLLVETLLEAGLPPQVVSLVTGSGSVLGDRLVTHPDVAMISFTGGLETGLSITRRAGIKKLAMELGSNSPTIVLRDADLERAVEAILSGAFGNAGQNCLGVQRVILEDEVADEFTERFLARVRDIKVGDKRSEETDMGPMISGREAMRVEGRVSEAVSLGARLLAGGRRQGAFYDPTVLRDVPQGCSLDREEIYGPVVSLYRVRDPEEAVRKANDSPYGLQAGVFTRDIDLAFRCVQGLEMGGVMINDSSDFRVDAMPFGGVKGSGLGREGIRYAAEAMTETKVVCLNLA
ncbi:MAG: aldehyde dehydrogenase family protein [Thermaerobacter sp.]|nr:aldehyde dehydrogenase family protein [Thermaerobacter sp.]